MKFEIKDLDKRDYGKIIKWSIAGFHYYWFTESRFLLNAYSRYYWYKELNNATQIMAAYVDGQFAGVLLASIDGEKKLRQNILQKLYIRIVDIVQKTVFAGATGLFEKTKAEQFAHYSQNHAFDGEILYFILDPNCTAKGIGTLMMNTFEAHERGKTLWLLTDSGCTYQFYNHRGFEKMEEKQIFLKMPKGKIPLTSYIYAKTIL